MSSVDRSPLLVENSVDTKVTRVFTNFENEKRQVLEPTTFGRHTVFHKEQPMGRRFDVRWSLVAQAIPENELFLSKMSIFRNREVVFSRAATLCGNVPFQCFGCTRPPTHRLVPLHLACTFSSTTAVYLQLKAQNSLR